MSEKTHVGELGKRVSVAVVAIPAVLLLVWLGGWVLALPLAGLAALGAGELYEMARRTDARPSVTIGMVGAALLVLVPQLSGSYEDAAPMTLGVLIAVGVLSTLSAFRASGPDGHPLSSISSTIFGVLYVGLPLSFIILLRGLPDGSGWEGDPRMLGALFVVLPLAATWIGDSSAYFAGSAWGRSKLAPTISPKKSWVGFWAGVAGAAGAAGAWSLAVRAITPLELPGGLFTWLAIGSVLGVGAVVGDLAESLLKREAGVKDSGAVFPGHGGVLDRVDSLLVTIPLAYALVYLLVRATS